MDDSIRSVALTVDSDGYFQLEYRLGSGQVCASLGTYHESDARLDFEETQKIEPKMATLAAIDYRKRKTNLDWYR